MDSDPRVALIMTFRNEAANLPAVLASLAAQTFPRNRLSLFAVDNGSSDGSAAVTREWLRETGVAGCTLRVDEPSIPAALNVAMRHVDADAIVVRLDAHAWYEPSYLATIVEAFVRLPSDVWCVGGAPGVSGGGTFGRDLHAALFASPMGLGPADYRRDTVSEVDSVLQRLGGYDERWSANEDAELAARLYEAGGRIYRIPVHTSLIVTRGAAGAFVQRVRYGWWRAQTIKRHPRTIRARHAAPSAALVGALALAATPARPALLLLAAAYWVAIYLYRPKNQSAALTAATMLYFPTVHAGFGAGILAGLVTGTTHSRKRAATPQAEPVR
jgi:glycosyltransferase involved in cell wall biosynthesis